MSDLEPWCTGEIFLGPATSGALLTLLEPLSFWGGVDVETGRIIDPHHPQCGASVRGTVLLMGPTRGSSSATSTYLECIRRDTAPSALLLTTDDANLVVASAAGFRLYGKGSTVVLLRSPPTGRLDGVTVYVEQGGNVSIRG